MATIPKILHYCWFGGNSLPELEQKCIASWSEVMPDWTVQRWDESNFDISRCRFSSNAYSSKAWAFVSDYARMRILLENGGIFLDTDVEVLQSFEPFIVNAAFAGFMKNNRFINPGLVMGSEPGGIVVEQLARQYESIDFEVKSGRNSMPTSPRVMTKLLVEQFNLKQDGSMQELDGFTAYPASYFDALDSHTGRLVVDDSTYSIHHYSGTWLNPAKKYRIEARKKLSPLVGDRLSWFLSSFLSVIRYGKDAF